ncbi:MAG: sigma 54-interacting transcriptional regulator [Proteobacteria bacterium]|nr:sigma 54-interacting transcriptional regulator [Pseudomonadota bacterium]
MSDAALVLVIVPLRGAHPLRIPIVKKVTTIGSEATADVRIPTAPARWAVVQRGDDAVEVHIPTTGEDMQLKPGERFEANGIMLALESSAQLRDRERVIEELTSALAAVDSPEHAVELMLAGLIGAAGADLGALILSEQHARAYTIAAARDRHGAVLQHAEDLLSDAIVRDVLGTGQRVQLDDVAVHARYATIPSIAALQIGAALCLPLRLDGRTLGAVFLARHDRGALDERALTEVSLLAAITVPFLAQLRRAPPPGIDELIGESEAVRALRTHVRRVGPSDRSLLLQGPSGSGKELVARALHAASPRATKPMIALNCASVAPSLLDAELFGYRKGAFTGAMTDRGGLVEAAHGSTLFLDEIHQMPLSMQPTLLHIIEHREVTRLGEDVPRAIDVRLICATHADLEVEVRAGRSRAALVARLREVTIDVPALAARGEDVVLLAYVFLRQVERQLGLVAHTLTEDADAALRAYAWPGNVRELKTTMRRVAILADDKLVRARDLRLA